MNFETPMTRAFCMRLVSCKIKDGQHAIEKSLKKFTMYNLRS